MPARRDPISEWFDRAARRLIRRAYARRGEWVGVYLPPPTPLERAYAAREGVYSLYERDRWGEVRWVRAYKRAVYYQLRKHGFADGPHWDRELVADWPPVSLEWQTGRRVMRSGWPARRWAIRVRLHNYGQAAAAATPRGEQWIGTDRQYSIDDQDWGELPRAARPPGG